MRDAIVAGRLTPASKDAPAGGHLPGLRLRGPQAQEAQRRPGDVRGAMRSLDAGAVLEAA